MSLAITDLFAVAGNTALVTGGSSGIGFGIASAFVANGVNTYITGRNAERLALAEAELSKLGQCKALYANLSIREGVDNLVKQFNEREKRLDFLVNNAGASWVEPIEHYSEAGWDRVFNLNAKAPFFLSQGLLPLMSRSNGEKWSRIVNIGSTAAENVDPNGAAYGPSKAALHHLTRVMARALARHHITVNCISPGMFASRLSDQLDDEVRARWAERSPASRLGNAADAGGTALYLCSRAGEFMNGQVLTLDGGPMA